MSHKMPNWNTDPIFELMTWVWMVGENCSVLDKCIRDLEKIAYKTAQNITNDDIEKLREIYHKIDSAVMLMDLMEK